MSPTHWRRRYFVIMRLRHTLYPFLALAFAGCNLLGGKCTYEIRSLQAAGTVNQNGGELASAQSTISENRGSIQGTSMYWLVTSVTLKGHVLSASFKDAADPSTVRLDLPLASADRPEITQGTADTRTGANLGGVHDMIAAGRGVIELQTDLPSSPTVTIPLSPTTNTDWIRPYCS